jgi:hypothetical protein
MLTCHVFRDGVHQPDEADSSGVAQLLLYRAFKKRDWL